MAFAFSLLTPYSSRQFALVRVGLGAYLAAHFGALVPGAWALYGTDGMFPAERAVPFPSAIGHFTSPVALEIYLTAFALLSVVFAFGIARRLVAIVLWYGWTSLVTRSPHLVLPHDGYVGWLLLATALVPGAEAWRVGPAAPELRMPAVIYYGAWFVVALAYSVSGIFKLASPSWQAGDALRFALECPFARLGWPRALLLSAPGWMLKGGTWAALALEVLFLPLCLHRQTRRVAWTLMVLFHLSIFATMDIASVTLALLLVHLFILDPSWFRRSDNARSDPTRVAP